MAITFKERTWLDWLVKVRIIIITALLAIELAIITLTTTSVNRRLFVGVMLAWYAVSAFHVVLVRIWDDVTRQSRLQILLDLFFATAVVYVTGGIDSSFNFLYPLIIIVASILISEAWAYLTAALAFILFGAILELAYFDLIHSFTSTHPDPKSLQAVIFINLFAYIAVAYLAGHLSSRIRQVNVELADKSGALQDLRALHENIVNSISTGLITTDLGGRIQVVNPAVPRLLERKEWELIGSPVQSLFRDALPDITQAGVSVEVLAVTPSGQEKMVAIAVAELNVPERGEIGLIYTLDDVTTLRRLEREVRMRERLAAVGRLASGIAHEIRNPLSSIAGSVKLLTGISALNDDQRALVDIVTRESDRLNNIITDFLVYSREKQCQMHTIDLVTLLQDTLFLLENHPDLKSRDGIEPRVKVVRNFTVHTAMARGDGDKLKQVFWNFCENAVRAIVQSRDSEPDRVGTLTVGLSEDAAGWQITFADTGAGMTPQQMDKIFEPFQGAFEGGTGLGMAIVYQILQAHSAKINVRSEAGHGTEFRVLFARQAKQMQTVRAAASLK